MVGVKCDGASLFCCDFNRERLSHLVGKIYLLAHFQILGTGKLRGFNRENGVWILLAIRLFRGQMDIHDLAHFHICHCRVKSSDHHACAADKLQRFATVIGRIELCSVIKGASVMCAAGFSYIASLEGRSRSASPSAVAAAGMSVSMISAGVSFFMVMITVCPC